MESASYVDVGKRLKQFRKSKKLTQEQISNIMEISVKYWSDVERGKQGISREFLLRLKKNFNISTDYILTGEISSNQDCPLIKTYFNCPIDKRESLVEIVDEIVRKLL